MNHLAISLLNRNGLEDTIACVDSILQSKNITFDIYLLDNNSKNNEYQKLQEKYGDVTTIYLFSSLTNLGFTGGNNYNIEKILQKGGYSHVLLLNNDSSLNVTFLADFLAKTNDLGKPCITGPIIMGTDGNTQAAGCTINLWTSISKRLGYSGTYPKKVDYVTGSCFLIPLEIIQKIGGLDNRYFAYWEESDYCLTAQKHGHSTYVVDVNGITHKEETAINKVKPYYTYLMFRNRILFLKKHTNILQYIVSWIILAGYLVIIFPLRFGRKNYKHALHGIRDALRGKFYQR